MSASPAMSIPLKPCCLFCPHAMSSFLGAWTYVASSPFVVGGTFVLRYHTIPSLTSRWPTLTRVSQATRRPRLRRFAK